jgi:hypothetical protein
VEVQVLDAGEGRPVETEAQLFLFLYSPLMHQLPSQRHHLLHCTIMMS